ncbi:hypothetical protein SAMN04488074_1042 [Lentzea albidocapillata subsp. violacea]|uniref:Uncharacterized protein n=1 Tax=Lentzea albidocapillata subsp. violacea TaxID=128104 RepID=A0A1G8YC69_9PSEU|nr:hypothetical protein SAMN04488074_1042 [Lentzea albidocapillata subsp. violacea]
MKLSYQYDDQVPPRSGGLIAGGSDQPIVTGWAGSVNSVAQAPAW